MEIAAVSWNDENGVLLMIIPNTRIREIFISKIVTLGIFQIADINFIMETGGSAGRQGRKGERRGKEEWREEDPLPPSAELNAILKALELRIMCEKLRARKESKRHGLDRREFLIGKQSAWTVTRVAREQFDRHPIHNEATRRRKKKTPPPEHVRTRTDQPRLCLART